MSSLIGAFNKPFKKGERSLNYMGAPADDGGLRALFPN